MTMQKSSLLALLACSSFIALMPALSAQAQSAGAAQADSATAEEVVEEIVITGSRLKRTELETTNPVVFVSAERLSAQGITNISEFLTEIPSLLNSNGTEQSLTNGNNTVGVATANLRGLGDARTLVLVNGRRNVSGVAGSAAVDINTIPTGLIERVDVLTGGASAIFGSDAVSGVVNFILKKDFTGIATEAQVGLSSRGDAFEQFLSITAGTNFGPDKNGNIAINITYNNRDDIRFRDRSFARGGGAGDIIANPDRTAGAPANIISRNVLFGLSSTAGIIGFDPRGRGFPESGGSTRLPVLDFDRNGTPDCNQSNAGRSGFGCLIIDSSGSIRPFQDGILVPGSDDQIGGDGVPDNTDNESLTPKIENFIANLYLNYEVSPLFKPFVEARFVRKETANRQGVNSFDDALAIELDNPFIPAPILAAYNAFLASNQSFAPTAQLILARDHTDIINDPTTRTRQNVYRIVTGFTGELENGFDYELSVNYGRTEERRRFPRRFIDRFAAAVDAVRAPNGTIVCRSDLNPASTTPANGTFRPGDGTCRPINLFGVGSPSNDARAFITADNISNATIEQFVVSGFLNGDTKSFLELPGGPVRFSVGGEYRDEKSNFVPSEEDRLNQIFRGGRVNQRGSFDAIEGFVEVEAPLLKDAPLAELLSIDGAVRVGDFSTSGSVTAYKFGGIYAPIPDIRVRGTYARTVRTPNISEFFAPLSPALFRVVDPCGAANLNSGNNPANRQANCAAAGIPSTIRNPTARISGLTGGSTDLQEETSTSFTLGVVLTPSFLPNLLISVDYYDIKIRDAISNPAAQDIIDNCFDAPNLQNQFCSLIARNTTAGSAEFQRLTSVTVRPLNFAQFRASGVDFRIRYNLDLADIGFNNAGRIILNANGSVATRNETLQTPDQSVEPNDFLREFRFPKLTINTSLAYEVGKFALDYSVFYQSNQTLNGVSIETFNTVSPAFTGDSFVHNISASYKFTDQIGVTFGVNNIFDRKPFLTELSLPASPVGTRFFLRAKAQF
jgi:iron complex outermembrane recepter protein